MVGLLVNDAGDFPVIYADEAIPDMVLKSKAECLLRISYEILLADISDCKNSERNFSLKMGC